MASILRIDALLGSGLSFREGLGWTAAVGHARARPSRLRATPLFLLFFAREKLL